MPWGIRHPFSCAETDKKDGTKSFSGLNYTAEFIGCLKERGVDQDRDNQEVTAIFHNLKGYDGMFLLQNIVKQRNTKTNN